MGNRPCKTCRSTTWFWNDEGRCNQCEERLKVNVQVLDYGYVKLVETWGSDERIVEAARMSTDKGFKGWGIGWHCSRALCDWKDESAVQLTKDGPCPKCGTTEIIRNVGDEKLLKYLYDHKHMTPFEMAGMTIEVQAPIFVFREWHRHRTQSYNELSARYTPIPDMNYVPTVERLMMSGGANKQAQGTGSELLRSHAVEFRKGLEESYANAEGLYQWGLSAGVPKELARLVIPVGRYSRMRASANLRNWLAFLTLRMDEAAQWEIRQYANVVAEMVADRFPRVYLLFSLGK